MGDSGAALLLDRTEDLTIGFQDIELLTVSAFSDLCIGEPAMCAEGGAILRTHSTEMARNGIYHTARHNRELMDKNGWSAKDSDHFIPHQVSTKLPKLFTQEFNKVSAPKDKIALSKMVQTVQDTGNTSSTAHTVALHRSLLEGRVKNDERVVFSVSASGLTVGTALYQFDDLPERTRQFERGKSVPKNGHAESAAGCSRPTGLDQVVVSLESVAVAPEEEHVGSRQTAVRAGFDCLMNSQYDAEDMNLLVSVGMYKSGYIDDPCNAAFIARELQLNHDFASEDYTRKTFAFDLNAGSTGWLHAVYVAQELVRAEALRRVLVVASEADENLNITGAAPLGISRVGTASILHPSENGTGFSNFFFETHVEHLDGFRSHVDISSEQAILCCEEAPHYGTMLLNCLWKTLIKFIDSLDDVELDNFDYIIGPQFSAEFDSEFVRLLNAVTPEQKLGERLVRYPSGKNLATSAVACGLHAIIENNADLAGKRVLLCSAGSGIQTACAIYQFDHPL